MTFFLPLFFNNAVAAAILKKYAKNILNPVYSCKKLLSKYAGMAIMDTLRRIRNHGGGTLKNLLFPGSGADSLLLK
jgi:hypothetical protein